MKSLASLLLSILVCVSANAAAIATGKPLPPLNVADKGEVIMNGKDYNWQPWSTDKATGTVHVIQYMAARASTQDMNKPFTDALAASAFPRDKYTSVTLVNMDDAMWGTSGLVPGELKKNKKLYPHERLIADAKGDGQKTWGLKKESSAIIVLDKQGNVVFFKDGALTPQEVQTTIKQIESLL